MLVEPGRQHFYARRMPNRGATPVPFDVLLPKARAGDEGAYRELAEQVKLIAWHVVRAFGLSHADAEDAVAATLFRFADKLDTVRTAAALPGWVATTARREVFAIFRSRQNVAAVDDVPTAATVGDVADGLLLDELRAALAAAFRRLSGACQALLRLAFLDPPLRYEEIGEILGKPHGSIGPERQRCLQRLRAMKELRPYVRGGES